MISACPFKADPPKPVESQTMRLELLAAVLPPNGDGVAGGVCSWRETARVAKGWSK